MLELITASQLPLLRDALLERLKKQASLSDFFNSEPCILVQNSGMRQWVKLELSQKMGAFARIDITFPGSAVFNLQRKSLGITDLKFGHKWPLTERIAMLLEQHKHSEAMNEASRQWYDPNDPQLSERRRWSFAQLIAETFDEYELYRWQQIDTWRKEANDWQKFLMKELYADELDGFRFRAMKQSLEVIASRPGLLAPEYHLFALPSLVPYQLEWVKVMGAHVPTYVYLLNDEVEGKIETHLSSHRPINTQWHLGTYLSEQKRDYFQLFKQSMQQAKDLQFKHTPITSPEVEIQNELTELKYRLQHTAESYSVLEPSKFEQERIHFASTHNRLREVEVLHDWLNQRLFDEGIHEDAGNPPTIKLDDVLIVSPNISAYKSHLESVFGNELSPFPIKFDIQLPRSSSTNPLPETINHGLSLLSGRCTTDEMLEWLSFKPIKERLNLQEEELHKMRDWLNLSGIRWGIDAKHKMSFNLPEVHLNSWVFGLQRLVLGLTAGSLNDLYHQNDALNLIQQQDDIELLGKISFVVRHLNEQREVLKLKKSMSDWLNWLGHCFEELVDKTELDQLINRIAKNLGLPSESEQEVSLKDASYLNFGVFKNVIQQELTTTSSGGSKQTGLMLCSDMVPMRTIPFKIIAILGLNDGEFPRNEKRAAFSYLNTIEAQKAGDRSRKLEDRALLKDYILSAEDYLFIGFQGKNAFTNEKIPPSPLLSQLIQEVRQIRYKGNASPPNILTEYPMQAHSSAYKPFDIERSKKPTNDTLYTTALARLNKQESNDFWEKLFKMKPLEWDIKIELSVQDASKRLADPIQAFVKDRLGIQLRDYDFFDKRDEVFQLDALQNHQLLSSLLNQEVEIHDFTPTKLLAKGICGDPLLAKTVHKQLESQLHEYAQLYHEILNHLSINQDKTYTIDQHVDIDNHLKIRIKIDLVDGWLFVKSASKKKYKYSLPLFLQNLLLSEWVPSSYKGLIYIHKNNDSTILKPNYLILNQNQDDDRKNKVEKVIRWLTLSYQKALPFHPLAADACIKKVPYKEQYYLSFETNEIMEDIDKETFKDELSTLLLNKRLIEDWLSTTKEDSFRSFVNFYYNLEHSND